MNTVAPSDQLLANTVANNPWRILVIDDEEDIHELTHFALEDYVFQGRSLEFLNAYSAQQAKVLLEQNSDIAVIFLDVVMETTEAGLQLVHYIRETLHNHLVRIILRTGQPGYAPEKEIILKYDINDYKNKTELTDKKLFVALTASLRAYAHLLMLQTYQQQLEAKVAERTAEIVKKNQELILLNQTLNKLHEEKRELLRIVSLDLKNPLSSIQELSNLIQQSFDNWPKDKLLELVRIIELSSQRMVALIKNLLNANALEPGEMNLAVGIFDFRPSLQFLKDDYVELAREKNLNLQFQLPPEEYKLLVNKGAILQILDNLICNAIKSSSPGKLVQVRLSKDGNFMRCEVQDQGPGLSEADLARWFGKFTRFTPISNGRVDTTAEVSLFIVRKLVEAMNGKIWCHSILGQGSTFIVEFPLANP